MPKLKRRAVKRFAKVLALLVVIGALFFGVRMLLNGLNIDVLNPQGEVAMKERNLIMFTLLLSLVVVVPVFTMLIVFSLRYNANNIKKARYTPDWDGSRTLETIWWGIPCIIILVLSVVTWQSSHDLDPFKKLDSPVKAIDVQVVSLQWKWLFIYPDQHIASVNLLQIPENTPVNFTLTSDAPMNSFWIPSLGGQVYAMSGMSTKLSLIANSKGDFRGSSSNISGTGFADMNFIARSSSRSDFDDWVKNSKKSSMTLDDVSYGDLVKPGTLDNPRTYLLADNSLYDKIVMKYMAPVIDDSHDSMSRMQMEGM
ncbi:MAG: ubiquinol oxidase subunit II [Candidatus Saccharimonadales bacterium]